MKGEETEENIFPIFLKGKENPSLLLHHIFYYLLKYNDSLEVIQLVLSLKELSSSYFGQNKRQFYNDAGWSYQFQAAYCKLRSNTRIR